MRSPVWGIDEIKRLPEFGADTGWFYGLIRYEGRIHFGEIFPGMGFASPWPMWRPRQWWWALRDICRARSFYVFEARRADPEGGEQR